MHQVATSNEAEKGLRLDQEDKQHAQIPRWKIFIISWFVTSASIFADLTSTDATTPVTSNELGLYGVAYTLASCAVIVSYGKLYSLYPAKTVFAASFVTLVLGSAISGHAPSPADLTIGSVVASLGNSGVIAGLNMIFVHFIPVRQEQWRPLYGGLVGGIECMALAIAPLLANAIAEYSSLRVGLYISVILGTVAVMMTLLFCLVPDTAQHYQVSACACLRWLGLSGMEAFFPPLVACLALVHYLDHANAWDAWAAKQAIVSLWFVDHARHT